MKTHDTEHRISSNEYHDYQIITILFVICSSFILGAIPIICGLGTIPDNQSQNILPTELTPWSVVGERY